MKVEMKTIRKSFFKIVEIKNNTIKTVNPQIRVANEGGDNNKLEEMPIGSSKTAMQKEKKKLTTGWNGLSKICGIITRGKPYL